MRVTLHTILQIYIYISKPCHINMILAVADYKTHEYNNICIRHKTHSHCLSAWCATELVTETGSNECVAIRDDVRCSSLISL